MTASPQARRRENGRQRLERETTAYLGFYAELQPGPMLEAYPMADGVRAHRLNVRRIANYGRRFPR